MINFSVSTNESAIVISYCKISIETKVKFITSSGNFYENWPIMRFGGSYPNNLTALCYNNSNWTSFGEFHNNGILWNKKTCSENLSQLPPGNYTVVGSCYYSDYRGSSFEGIYHGGIEDFKIIEIIN